MKFIATKFPEVLLIEPVVHEDPRGYFSEGYNKNVFAEHGIRVDFVQDNFSLSGKGVLRGLHYQESPKAQTKLVRVLAGEVFDVVMDIRKGSKTFGQYEGHVLTAENKKMLYIPAGFAHGFLALKNGTEFLYKVSDDYSKAHERGVLWSDPELGIAWPKLDVDYVISDKDRKNPTLRNIPL